MILPGFIVVEVIAVTSYPAAYFVALLGRIAVGDIFMTVTVSLNLVHSCVFCRIDLTCPETRLNDTLDEELVLQGIAHSSSKV